MPAPQAINTACKIGQIRIMAVAAFAFRFGVGWYRAGRRVAEVVAHFGEQHHVGRVRIAPRIGDPVVGKFFGADHARNAFDTGERLLDLLDDRIAIGFVQM